MPMGVCEPPDDSKPTGEAALAGATGSAWEFTPSVKWVIARAAKLAAAEKDPMIRTSHIEIALRESENRTRCTNCSGTGWVMAKTPNDQAQAQPD